MSIDISTQLAHFLPTVRGFEKVDSLCKALTDERYRVSKVQLIGSAVAALAYKVIRTAEEERLRGAELSWSPLNIRYRDIDLKIEVLLEGKEDKVPTIASALLGGSVGTHYPLFEGRVIQHLYEIGSEACPLQIALYSVHEPAEQREGIFNTDRLFIDLLEGEKRLKVNLSSYRLFGNINELFFLDGVTSSDRFLAIRQMLAEDALRMDHFVLFLQIIGEGRASYISYLYTTLRDSVRVSSERYHYVTIALKVILDAASFFQDAFYLQAAAVVTAADTDKAICRFLLKILLETEVVENYGRFVLLKALLEEYSSTTTHEAWRGMVRAWLTAMEGSMPDIRPYISDLVRRGEVESLIGALGRVLRSPYIPPPGSLQPALRGLMEISELPIVIEELKRGCLHCPAPMALRDGVARYLEKSSDGFSGPISLFDRLGLGEGPTRLLEQINRYGSKKLWSEAQKLTVYLQLLFLSSKSNPVLRDLQKIIEQKIEVAAYTGSSSPYLLFLRSSEVRVCRHADEISFRLEIPWTAEERFFLFIPLERFPLISSLSAKETVTFLQTPQPRFTRPELLVEESERFLRKVAAKEGALLHRLVSLKMGLPMQKERAGELLEILAKTPEAFARAPHIIMEMLLASFEVLPKGYIVPLAFGYQLLQGFALLPETLFDAHFDLISTKTQELLDSLHEHYHGSSLQGFLSKIATNYSAQKKVGRLMDLGISAAKIGCLLVEEMVDALTLANGLDKKLALLLAYKDAPRLLDTSVAQETLLGLAENRERFLSFTSSFGKKLPSGFHLALERILLKNMTDKQLWDLAIHSFSPDLLTKVQIVMLNSVSTNKELIDLVSMIPLCLEAVDQVLSTLGPDDLKHFISVLDIRELCSRNEGLVNVLLKHAYRVKNYDLAEKLLHVEIHDERFLHKYVFNNPLFLVYDSDVWVFGAKVLMAYFVRHREAAAHEDVKEFFDRFLLLYLNWMKALYDSNEHLPFYSDAPLLTNVAEALPRPLIDSPVLQDILRLFVARTVCFRPHEDMSWVLEEEECFAFFTDYPERVELFLQVFPLALSHQQLLLHKAFDNGSVQRLLPLITKATLHYRGYYKKDPVLADKIFDFEETSPDNKLLYLVALMGTKEQAQRAVLRLHARDLQTKEDRKLLSFAFAQLLHPFSYKEFCDTVAIIGDRKQILYTDLVVKSISFFAHFTAVLREAESLGISPPYEKTLYEEMLLVYKATIAIYPEEQRIVPLQGMLLSLAALAKVRFSCHLIEHINLLKMYSFTAEDEQAAVKAIFNAFVVFCRKVIKSKKNDQIMLLCTQLAIFHKFKQMNAYCLSIDEQSEFYQVVFDLVLLGAQIDEATVSEYVIPFLNDLTELSTDRHFDKLFFQLLPKLKDCKSSTEINIILFLLEKMVGNHSILGAPHELIKDIYLKIIAFKRAVPADVVVFESHLVAQLAFLDYTLEELRAGCKVRRKEKEAYTKAMLAVFIEITPYIIRNPCIQAMWIHCYMGHLSTQKTPSKTQLIAIGTLIASYDPSGIFDITVPSTKESYSKDVAALDIFSLMNGTSVDVFNLKEISREDRKRIADVVSTLNRRVREIAGEDGVDLSGHDIIVFPRISAYLFDRLHKHHFRSKARDEAGGGGGGGGAAGAVREIVRLTRVTAAPAAAAAAAAASVDWREATTSQSPPLSLPEVSRRRGH